MRLEAALETLGAGSLEEVVRRERWKLQKRWRSAFASDWHDWSGPLLDMDWHVFSYNYVRYLEGAEAVSAFELMPDTCIIASASLARGPTIRCTFEVRPDYLALRNVWAGDLYLMNEALEWTLVLTHEEDFGPYFVERSDATQETVIDLE